jgi:glycosyltransferase involved in cell wall biosynthesis
MRVEFVKKRLQTEGHMCVVLNTGPSRRIPSTEYETVLHPLDYLRKLWKYSTAGYTVHAHVNGDSSKGFVLAFLAEGINLLTGKRCYLTFHAGTDQIFFPKHKAPALAPIFWLMFTIPVRIICNSAAVKEKIVEYGINPEKIVPIPAFTKQYLEFAPVPLPADAESFFARFSQVMFTYIRVREGFDLPTLIEGFALVASRRCDCGLLLLGVTDGVDPAIWADLEMRLDRHRLRDRVCILEDLDHPPFLTALTRSAMFIRMPTTDGVASSVLEAMSVGVPVVAAQNGTRPRGTVTFEPGSASDLAAKIEYTLAHRDAIVATAPRPQIADTLSDEVQVLTGG